MNLKPPGGMSFWSGCSSWSLRLGATQAMSRRSTVYFGTIWLQVQHSLKLKLQCLHCSNAGYRPVKGNRCSAQIPAFMA
eukprot:486171-Hanusia_phi.AAC.1